MSKKCCSGKLKNREEKEKRALGNRLSRIEGQIRGIKGMVDSEAYCTDIIVQVMAVQAALNAFNKELLGQHIRTCVVDEIQEGNLEVIDELVTTIQKIMK